MSETWKPRAVSFSSGGVRSLGHLGVLARLLESEALTDVREWYGCSGGSMVAYLGALGVTTAWVRDFARHFDVRPMLTIQDDLLLGFTDHWGIDTGAAGLAYLGAFLDTWEPAASSWTFRQFSESRPGIFLGITAVNITEGRLEMFSVDTYPDMRIIDAIRASSAVPFLYTPWVGADGALYVDGAVLESCPWAHLRSSSEETLMIACSEGQLFGRLNPQIDSLGDYMTQLIRICRRSARICNPKHWIAVNNTTVHMFDFQITSEDRAVLIADGEAAAAHWLATKRAAVPENPGTPASSGIPNTSPSTHPPSSDRTWGIPKSQIPPLQPSLSRDLSPGGRRRNRRWSL